jgi:hypothetical protein
MMAGPRHVQYLVLPDPTHPYLLARVRWPDVCQAISPVRPDWQDDPGLFDLPYNTSSTSVTREHAAMIAAEWDAYLPPDDGAGAFVSPLMRRMPADWSNLTRAEKRAWSIDLLKTPRRDARPRFAVLRWWRRAPRVRPAYEPFEMPAPRPVFDVAAPVVAAPRDEAVTVFLDEEAVNITGGWFDGNVVSIRRDNEIDLTEADDVPTAADDA